MVCSSFLSVGGRKDLLFWGSKLQEAMWESRTEQEKASWLEKASTTHDWQIADGWVVWCKSKNASGRRKSADLSSARKKNLS